MVNCEGEGDFEFIEGCQDHSDLYLNFDAVWIAFFNFEENSSKLRLVSFRFDEDRSLGPGAIGLKVLLYII